MTDWYVVNKVGIICGHIDTPQTPDLTHHLEHPDEYTVTDVPTDAQLHSFKMFWESV